MKKLSPEQVIKKFQKLKGERSTWEEHWQEIADFIIPRKDITRQTTAGTKRNVDLLDNTAVLSNELLAGALQGMLTNPNGEWFEFTTGDAQLDEEDEVRKWLQQTATDVHGVLNNSNFQTEVHEMYLDLTGFGTAPMSVEEDDESVVMFASRPLADVYVDEDSKGRINQLYRCIRWSVDQIVQEFGENSLPRKLRQEYDKGDTDTKYEVIHAVYAGDRTPFKFYSQYILVCEKHELHSGGYREFPYVVPRWVKTNKEKYGRSPGMNALPEAKTLNVMMDTTIRGAQKVVDPPIQVPDDGFLLPILTKPGGLNYYRAGTTDRAEPIFNDAKVDFGFQLIEMKKKQIREAFYVDQLKLQQDGPQMTATEVLQRTEEAMRLLGPMLGRLQSEFLRPLIDRVFEIMMRKNKVRPVPVQLRGRVIDVKYSSLIAKSQRISEGQNIMRTLQAIEPFYNIDPNVRDNLNGDVAARKLGRIYGCPQEIFRDKKEIDDIREKRAQAQQEQLQAQNQQMQAEQAAKVLPAVAKAQKATG